MKKIFKFLLTFLLFFLTTTVYWNTNIWDFSDETEYTISNTNTVNINWWFWKLIPQINHIWSINNWAWWSLLNWADWVVVDWNYAYMVSYQSDALNILDISNPANPTIISTLSNWNLNWARKVVKSWNYLYISWYIADNISVVNVSNPNNPIIVSTINDWWNIYLNWSYWLYIYWNYLFTTAYQDDSINIFDLSNPANPTFVSSLRDRTRLNWATWVFVLWNYLYVTSTINDSLEIINISNINNPVFQWQITNGTALLNAPYDVFINWNFAYIASDQSDAVEIVDVSNPANPSHISSITNWTNWITLNWPRAIHYDKGYLYVSSYTSDSLSVIDVYDPYNPIWLSNVWENATNELNWATSIFKLWNYIYVWAYIDDGMEIIEITYDNSSPSIIPNNPLVYSWSIDMLSEVLSENNNWNLTYQLSKDNWNTWYYLNWIYREATTNWTVNSNTYQEINSEIQTFNGMAWWDWNFKWKAFLNWNWTSPTEVDEISTDFTTSWANEIIDFESPWWYTVTQGTFSRTTTTPFEWLYSIESWNNTDNSTSCFNVTRTLYNDYNLSFQYKVSSESWYDFLRFYIDWNEIINWSWEVDWDIYNYELTNGTYSFEWCYTKDWSVSNGSDKAWVDYIFFEEKEQDTTVEVALLDFEVVWWYTVTTNVTWTDTDWQRVTTQKYEWSYSIESQTTWDNQTVCFFRNETIDTTENAISFYYKVSSEASYDFLRFYVDWAEIVNWSWEIDWSKYTYNLSPWNYDLSWCYTKDWSVSNGSDKAWVDYVTVVSEPPVLEEITAVTTPTNDNTPDYTFYTPVSWTISYGWACSGSITTANVWNNTVTFDTLSDWIYTDCTIQVLASPENSIILNVTNFTIDTTWIDIVINNPIDSSDIANTSFNLDVSYSDAEVWVDTSTIIVELYKWNWSDYWTDISWTYVDMWNATIWPSNSIIPVSQLWEWQFKIIFKINDNLWNISIANTIFNVLSWDSTPPNINIVNPTSDLLSPIWNMILNINYDDIWSWINTSSIIIEVRKWDITNSIWWNDISSGLINSSNITWTWASYDITNNVFWKYKLYFYIEDNSNNWWFQEVIYYIDEVNFIISDSNIDLWNLITNSNKYSNDINLTVDTVWAWFEIYIVNDSKLNNWSIDIIDWNWTNGFWYEKTPYINQINQIINWNTIISNSWSINTSWEKNTYIYTIRLWANIDEEQSAWIYNWNINFWIKFQY